uniref:Transthyretin-like family protein n=1 Tax=Trichuris muris TaxID=70415 RepID=A0A5S6Q339_TRIMR
MAKVLFFLCLCWWIGFIECAQKCVEAKGKLYCRSNPLSVSNAEVRLYDKDGTGILQALDPDDLMGVAVPEEDGSFKIHGCADDADWIPSIPNVPDPYLQIRHSCKSYKDETLVLDKGIKFFPEVTNFGVIDLDN